MNLIATLDFDTSSNAGVAMFDIRNTARAVIFDGDNAIALMRVAKGNFHKLPGGGIDDGETPEQALVRECKEEAGATIADIREIGLIQEIHKEKKIVQNSYCYTARVVGDKSLPQLTDAEIENGFEVSWVSIGEAIRRIKNDGYTNLAGRYVSEREICILQAVAKNV